MGKGKVKDDTFYLTEEKKTEEKWNSATIMISEDGKGTVLWSEAEITSGIVWIKILKNRILKKIQRI